jgi:hypothetical protein
MPQNGYDGPITLNADPTTTRAVTALQAAGYTGRFGFTRVTLLNKTGNTIYFARRSDVSAANGRPIENDESYTFETSSPGTIDFNQMYFYSLPGGTVQFTGETR